MAPVLVVAEVSWAAARTVTASEIWLLLSPDPFLLTL